MKKIWHLVISLALTVFIGYLIYRSVPDWNEAFRVMVQGRPLFMVAAFGFAMLHMLLRATRWGVLLAHVKAGISFKNLFSLTLVKYVVNIIPPRAGEVAASVILAKKEKISSASVLAASIFERILDALTVIAFFAFYLVFFADDFMPSTERGFRIFSSIKDYSLKGMAILAIGFLILALLLRNKGLLAWMPKRINKLVMSFLEGFRSLHNRKSSAWVVVLSVAIWLAIIMQSWLLLLAYLDQFPFVGTFMILAMSVIGISIPTPGGVGGYQFFMNLALVNFFAQYLTSPDIHSQAAGISNGSYLVSMVPIILIGLVLLNREGLSLRKISEVRANNSESSKKTDNQSRG